MRFIEAPGAGHNALHGDNRRIRLTESPIVRVSLGRAGIGRVIDVSDASESLRSSPRARLTVTWAFLTRWASAGWCGSHECWRRRARRKARHLERQLSPHAVAATAGEPVHRGG